MADRATMNVLLSFVGFHDPYSRGLVGEQDQPGPILSLLEARSFDKVILFSTPNTSSLTDETLDAVTARHSEIDVERRDILLGDPTDYEEILRGLRQHLREIQEDLKQAKFFVGVNSGTPQMHASWVLLSASGEIPAHLLSIRPPRFVEKDAPLVTEVDVTSPLFPIIRRGPSIPDDVRGAAPRLSPRPPENADRGRKTLVSRVFSNILNPIGPIWGPRCSS